jgi:DNA-binding MarR family transcriptional regulator
MSDASARGGQTTYHHDAVHRLTHDWLSGLLEQFVRAAGLLQPGQPGPFGHTSLSEAWALMELARGEPLTQRDLSERLDLEKSTVSRLVVSMERRGLITRRRNPENRRFAEVAITDHGREVINQLASDMLDRHTHIFAEMTAHEREALATGLGALVRAMRHAHETLAHDQPSA